MRRDALPVSSLLCPVVLLAFAVSCKGPAESPPATPPETPKARIDVTALDVFSGCEQGAPVVKVLIYLHQTDAGACSPEVTPASVCVRPEGKVHFKVKNNCEKPVAPRVTEPKLKRNLDGLIPELRYGRSRSGERPPLHRRRRR